MNIYALFFPRSKNFAFFRLLRRLEEKARRNLEKEKSRSFVFLLLLLLSFDLLD